MLRNETVIVTKHCETVMPENQTSGLITVGSNLEVYGVRISLFSMLDPRFLYYDVETA